METITNAASTVGSTVSSLIYGQPAKDNEATGNETAGKEPVSGQQGKGTLNEPFDQGNAETPVDSSKTSTLPDRSKDATSSGNTSYKEDDFLKLSPATGAQSSTTDASKSATGATGESAIPIIPLNPDAATSGGDKTNTTSSSTGATDKAWKPTALDEVKPEGAPGAGPSAPDFTPATPDLSSNKASEPTSTETAKGSSTADSSEKKHSVDGGIDAILGSQPKSKHDVDDRIADDPHSKMANKTVRQTDASKTGESEGSKSLASEKVGTTSGSSGKAGEPSGDNDEKNGKKMSHFKDKLKDKLHIGSKDK